GRAPSLRGYPPPPSDRPGSRWRGSASRGWSSIARRGSAGPGGDRLRTGTARRDERAPPRRAARPRGRRASPCGASRVRQRGRAARRGCEGSARGGRGTWFLRRVRETGRREPLRAHVPPAVAPAVEGEREGDVVAWAPVIRETLDHEAQLVGP